MRNSTRTPEQQLRYMFASFFGSLLVLLINGWVVYYAAKLNRIGLCVGFAFTSVIWSGVMIVSYLAIRALRVRIRGQKV
jgi:hypothetical protein